MTKITDKSQLEPGAYYLCVILDEDYGADYDCAPIYQYLGDGEWEDNAYVLDPIMSKFVHASHSDEWIKQ